MGERMQAVREDRFEELFASEYPRLVAAAARFVDRSTAEDAAQEAFAGWFARSGDAAPEQARRWLYTATVHRALDALRTRRRRDDRERRIATPSLADDPSDTLERRELRDAVRKALDGLRPAYAAVLALRYAGFSHREIAETLDLKINAVGTMLARAEAAFKKEYDRVSSR